MEKFKSRKFIVTLLVLLSTVVLAAVEALNSNVAMVLGAIVGSYNVMQGLVDKNG